VVVRRSAPMRSLPPARGCRSWPSPGPRPAAPRRAGRPAAAHQSVDGLAVLVGDQHVVHQRHGQVGRHQVGGGRHQRQQEAPEQLALVGPGEAPQAQQGPGRRRGVDLAGADRAFVLPVVSSPASRVSPAARRRRYRGWRQAIGSVSSARAEKGAGALPAALFSELIDFIGLPQAVRQATISCCGAIACGQVYLPFIG
jgi:hypothetical protein